MGTERLTDLGLGAQYVARHKSLIDHLMDRVRETGTAMDEKVLRQEFLAHRRYADNSFQLSEEDFQSAIKDIGRLGDADSRSISVLDLERFKELSKDGSNVEVSKNSQLATLPLSVQKLAEHPKLLQALRDRASGQLNLWVSDLREEIALYNRHSGNKLKYSDDELQEIKNAIGGLTSNTSDIVQGLFGNRYIYTEDLDKLIEMAQSGKPKEPAPRQVAAAPAPEAPAATGHPQHGGHGRRAGERTTAQLQQPRVLVPQIDMQEWLRPLQRQVQPAAPWMMPTNPGDLQQRMMQQAPEDFLRQLNQSLNPPYATQGQESMEPAEGAISLWPPQPVQQPPRQVSEFPWQRRREFQFV